MRLPLDLQSSCSLFNLPLNSKYADAAVLQRVQPTDSTQTMEYPERPKNRSPVAPGWNKIRFDVSLSPFPLLTAGARSAVGVETKIPLSAWRDPDIICLEELCSQSPCSPLPYAQRGVCGEQSLVLRTPNFCLAQEIHPQNIKQTCQAAHPAQVFPGV